MPVGNRRADLATELHECSIALITPNHSRVACGILGIDSLQFWRDGTGNNKDIRITVVIQIENPGSPTAETTFSAETSRRSQIFEFTFASIVVQSIRLVDKVSLK